MSDQNNAGGGDRTVFDPLSADELKALREARQKLRGGGEGARPAVGPDSGDDIGDAPTRAMKAIPSLDSGGVTLESLDTRGTARVMPEPQPMKPQAPKSATPQQPMSVNMTVPSKAEVQAMGVPSEAPGPGQPRVGEPGFGENTLMWMQPVKPAQAQPSIIPERGAAAAAGMIPTQVPQNTTQRKIGLGIVGALIVVTIFVAGFFFMTSAETSKVELVTQPARATVKIDGNETGIKTPMVATLPVGEHTVEVSLEGYRTETFSLDVKADGKSERQDIALYPLSNPGLQTITVNVSPVNANITIDDKLEAAKRSLRMANLDPKKEHKLVIEAGGFKKIEKTIKKGELREEYNFILEAIKDDE